jgi:hypothetical protein
MAVRTRGAETQGHSSAAPGIGLCLDRNDLAGLVGRLRVRRRGEGLPSYRIPFELLAVAVISLTGHLGGFLSGVNGSGQTHRISGKRDVSSR